ncbi:dihydrofolate reductase family protein [Amycolatopsis sp. FDAARGOS 1241]|uniref:dihydrofolate reductase family protein n=1 Tax=Amycolatopsis sp. FDAARGOS 1241 TaxID=2778070 RepID=UPI001951B09A|nr:dihydrofolate reductase family protein [Amycolatopsis sp. FDAARGOS 1241]QRP47576.1 dihydrofolate reductase family protein [Amycolatopsis sp. FDAARGOS 1241]
MRKVVSTLFVSLDGVVEAPDLWSLSYWTPELERAVGTAVADADAMLLGRVTYEGFAHAWPGRTNTDDPGAQFLDSVRKYVASTTLATAGRHDTTLLQGDLRAAITDLKNQPGGTIMTSGSTTLVRWLLAHGLVDELTLVQYPVVVGGGRRLFPLEGPPLDFALERSTAFANGVLQLVYRPVS